MTSTLDAPRRTAGDPPAGGIEIRAATAVDAEGVHRLIMDNLLAGHLLPRPRGEIELHVPRFLVAAAGDEVVGCGELARLSPAVAEVRSLVVAGSHRGAASAGACWRPCSTPRAARASPPCAPSRTGRVPS